MDPAAYVEVLFARHHDWFQSLHDFVGSSSCHVAVAFGSVVYECRRSGVSKLDRDLWEQTHRDHWSLRLDLCNRCVGDLSRTLAADAGEVVEYDFRMLWTMGIGAALRRCRLLTDRTLHSLAGRLRRDGFHVCTSWVLSVVDRLAAHRCCVPRSGSPLLVSGEINRALADAGWYEAAA